MKFVRTPRGKKDVLKESPPDGQIGAMDSDSLMLEDSLGMTPWERMQANDDALNFAESLREAMEKRNAKLK